MKKLLRLVSLSAVLALAGCAVMEQYHQDLTADQKKVPTKVFVGLSRTHANTKINSVERQVMFNGVTRYAFDVLEDGNQTVLYFDENGQPLTKS